jgi:putative phosphoribosyl transferase
VSTSRFENLRSAGERLALRASERNLVDPVVIGMARGGALVAAPVAEALSAPLDVAIVRKVGAPGQPEAAIGAIAEGGVEVFDGDVLDRGGIDREWLAMAVAREHAELDRQLETYREGVPPLALSGRIALLVDDGLATGLSAIAAARSLRKRGASEVILAIPVGSPDAILRLERDGEVDEVICLLAPERLRAIGLWYDDFSQASDQEVIDLLAAARRRSKASPTERAP